MIFLEMVTEWLLLQLEQDPPNFILQLDGASPYYHLDVRTELDNLPERWILRPGPNDDALFN